MTPEELDEARAKEAEERWRDMHPNDRKHTLVGTIAARLAREGWTPPEPEPVDPDVLAFREWLASDHEADGWTGGATLCRLGRHDGSEEARAYRAGARMAREQERERAKVLVSRLSDLILRVEEDWALGDVTGINASEMISAREALAKYRGEA